MAPRRLLKAETRQIESRLRDYAQWFSNNDIDLASPNIYPLVYVLIATLSQIRSLTNKNKK